jgi:Asp-tRNA(Asn)/Glu-tRNA(Gln) amidotransferase B subunit
LIGRIKSDDEIGMSMQTPKVSEEQLHSILALIQGGTISGKIGKAVLQQMYNGNKGLAADIVQEQGWGVMNDEKQLRVMCQELVASCPEQVCTDNPPLEQRPLEQRPLEQRPL